MVLTRHMALIDLPDTSTTASQSIKTKRAKPYKPEDIFRFLDLPPELRTLIYTFAFTRSDPAAIVRRPNSDKFKLGPYSESEKPMPPAPLHTDLLWTCKQVRKEATPVLYATVTFLLGRKDERFPESPEAALKALNEWSRSIGKTNMAAMRILRLACGQLIFADRIRSQLYVRSQMYDTLEPVAYERNLEKLRRALQLASEASAVVHKNCKVEIEFSTFYRQKKYSKGGSRYTQCQYLVFHLDVKDLKSSFEAAIAKIESPSDRHPFWDQSHLADNLAKLYKDICGEALDEEVASSQEETGVNV